MIDQLLSQLLTIQAFDLEQDVGQHFILQGKRQFSQNICSEDDLRSRIFGTFFCKIPYFPACPGIFKHLKHDIIAHF